MPSGLVHPRVIDPEPAAAAIQPGLRSRLPIGLEPILCLAAVLACIALAHPFANSAFNDDWSYSDVALKFAQSGRFQYNGWGSPTILFQTLWGAAWIRVFGFSFDVLRAATIPFSLAFVFLVYALGRKVGLTRHLALFGALTVGTSPLFLPLASSFMTDVYGCFFFTGCVYGAVACVQTNEFAPAVRGLWMLALSGIAGGSNRQVLWLAPLLLFPYLGWLRGRDRRFTLHALAAYALCITSMAVVLNGFSQPYAPLELSARQISRLLLDGWFVGLALTAATVLSGLLIALPAFLFLSPRWKGLSAWQCLKCCLLAAAATALLACIFGGSDGLAPFLGNILTPFGILKPGQDALGFRPVQLPELFRIALTWLLFFSVGAFACLYRGSRASTIHSPWRVFALVSGPSVVLLVPGAMVVLVYDRYMLPLLPLLVIFILWKFQPSMPTVPWAAWLCLLLFAAYGVATTHDYFSGLRARAAAAQAMEASGIARNRISAGFEYDGWTQVQASGHIQNIHYDERTRWNTTNQFGFWVKTTAIIPDYVASYWQAAAVPEKGLATVPFVTWFPPFHRAVVVLRRADLPKDQGNPHVE